MFHCHVYSLTLLCMCLRAHVHVCVHAYDMSVGGQLHQDAERCSHNDLYVVHISIYMIIVM